MFYYGLEWQSLDSYFQFKEITAPDTPPPNEVRLYAKDSGGASTLCIKSDTGGETCFPVGAGTLPAGSAAANRVAVWLTAATLTGYPTFVYDPSNDQVYFGNDITGTPHLGSDGLAEFDKNANNAIIAVGAHTATAAQTAALHLIRTRGTHSAQTVVSDGDSLGHVTFKGHGGTTIHDAASIRGLVNGTPGNNDMPGRLVLLTTPDGSATLVERATVDQKGDFGLGTTTPNYAGFTRTMTIESATNTALELASSRADADAVLIGALGANYRTNSTNHQRFAEIQFFSDGGTANQRGGSLRIFTKANASTTLSEKWRFDAQGFLGSGAIAPVLMLDLRGTGATTAIGVERDNGQATFIGYRVRGGGTATQSADLLSIYAGGGSHTGATADRATSGFVSFTADANWTGSSKPSRIGFHAIPSGSTTNTEYWRITSAGVFQGVPSGGSTIQGGSGSGDDLTLSSTSNATKGTVFLGSAQTSGFDETLELLGLGTGTPAAGLDILAVGSNNARRVVNVKARNDAGQSPIFQLFWARGTSSDAAAQNGDTLGDFSWTAYDGTAQGQGPQLRGFATQNWTGSVHGSGFQFRVVPNGGTSVIAAWRIENSGDLVNEQAATKIDLSAITAGNPNLKITATSDTPAVTWGAVSETIKVSTAPAGYLEILVGANARYIPFWA